jgi:hypothetical protein
MTILISSGQVPMLDAHAACSFCMPMLYAHAHACPVQQHGQKAWLCRMDMKDVCIDIMDMN